MAHVLLIEPDHLLAETYSQALTKAGYQVATRTTAQSAIAAADQKRPDVVILELQLIEHSGIEFLYEFRSYQDWQAIPVLIQTHVPPGEFTAHRQMLKHQLHVQTYLYKPQTTLRQLVDQVDAHLPVKA